MQLQNLIPLLALFCKQFPIQLPAPFWMLPTHSNQSELFVTIYVCFISFRLSEGRQDNCLRSDVLLNDNTHDDIKSSSVCFLSLLLPFFPSLFFLSLVLITVFSYTFLFCLLSSFLRCDHTTLPACSRYMKYKLPETYTLLQDWIQTPGTGTFPLPFTSEYNIHSHPPFGIYNRCS
jgi:hypothetical protein